MLARRITYTYLFATIPQGKSERMMTHPTETLTLCFHDLVDRRA